MTSPANLTSLESLLALMAGGGLRFDNRPIFSLTIPSNAGPNDPRIFIGSPLPPPLDTYVFYGVSVATAGIIFYLDADTYVYLVSQSGPNNTDIVMGLVIDGVIPETADGPGFPISVSWEFDFLTGIINMFMDFGEGDVIMPDLLDVRLFGDIFAGTTGRIIVESSGQLLGLAGSIVDFAGAVTADSLRHKYDHQNTASTTTSTTYVNPTNLGGVAFTAPESGIVSISYTAQVFSTAATGGVAFSPRIGEGSTVGAGTLVLAASDVNAAVWIQHATVSEGASVTSALTLTGLTPGTVYNVSIQFRSLTAATTASIQRITTTVIPSP